jgi:hypothetical protein
MAFIKFLQYIILKFTSSTILLYLPSPISGTVSTGAIFPFTYMYTQYLLYIHPPMPFPHLLPPLLRYQSTTTPRWICSIFLLSDFVKKIIIITFLLA